MEKSQRRRTKAGAKNTDYLVKIISVQITICAVIFILALCSSKFAGEGFTAFLDEYKRLTENDISISEIKDVFIKKSTEESTSSAEKSEGKNDETQNVVAPLDETDGEDISGTNTNSNEKLSTVNLSNLKIINSSAVLSSLIETKPVIPVEGYRISSEFGYRNHPITKEYQLHSGTDFAAPEGSIIRAVLDGKVTNASYSKARGNYIIIEHENGMETYYCHCLKLLVKEGTVIRAGESIALVGSTGDSTGPHLHLEVHINGVPKNALKTIFKGYDI